MFLTLPSLLFVLLRFLVLAGKSMTFAVSVFIFYSSFSFVKFSIEFPTNLSPQIIRFFAS